MENKKFLLIFGIFALAFFSSCVEAKKEHDGGKDKETHIPKLEDINQVMFRKNCDDSCTPFESRFLSNEVAFWTGGRTSDGKEEGSFQARLSSHHFKNLVELLLNKNFFTLESTSCESDNCVELGAIWTAEGEDMVKLLKVNDNSLNDIETAISELVDELDWTLIPNADAIESITRVMENCETKEGEDEESCTVQKLELHHEWAFLETEKGLSTNMTFSEEQFRELAYSFITNGFFIMQKEYGTRSSRGSRLVITVEYYPQSDYSQLDVKAVASWEKVLPKDLSKIESSIEDATKDLAKEFSLISDLNLISVLMSGITLVILLSSVVLAITVLRNRRRTDYGLVGGKDIEMNEEENSNSPALVFKKERPIL